jgi:hypothetical protein
MLKLSETEKTNWTAMWKQEEVEEWYSPIYQELKDEIALICIKDGVSFVEKGRSYICRSYISILGRLYVLY